MDYKDTILRGLRVIGREEIAKEIARCYYAACGELFEKTGTILENISTEQSGRPKKAMESKDFCGGGACAPVSKLMESTAGHLRIVEI